MTTVELTERQLRFARAALALADRDLARLVEDQARCISHAAAAGLADVRQQLRRAIVLAGGHEAACRCTTCYPWDQPAPGYHLGG